MGQLSVDVVVIAPLVEPQQRNAKGMQNRCQPPKSCAEFETKSRGCTVTTECGPAQVWVYCILQLYAAVNMGSTSRKVFLHQRTKLLTFPSSLFFGDKCPADRVPAAFDHFRRSLRRWDKTFLQGSVESDHAWS